MIPAAFASTTVDREGSAGVSWLADLPSLVDHYLALWSCSLDGPWTHGQVGLIVPIRRNAAPGVLKISFPHPGNVAEPSALAAWDGGGAVRLLERDDAQFAMLLERAGPATLDGLDTDAALIAAGELARRLAVVAPAEIPRLADAAAAWAAQLIAQSNELSQPLPAAVLGAALETVDAFSNDPGETLMHGDLHFANVLRSDREPWLAIDPKGFAGSAAYDAATIVRDRPLELLAATDLRKALIRRIDIFSEAAQVDRELARRATQARLVSSAFWERLHGRPGFELAGRIAGLLV
ncbi:MAG: streptomycin 6-kinase [Kribbellaceae bacterium]|nr:streptomycin 6-kinase [Kribbellaceae bacterium]